MAEEKDRERKFAKDFLEKWLRAEGEEGPAEEALKKVEEALRASPDDPALSFRRGTLLLDLDKFEDALEAFRRVEAVAPDHPRLYVALSFALTKLGRVEEAAEAQKKAMGAEVPGLEGRPPESAGEMDEALAGLAEDLKAEEREEEAVKGLVELETLAVGPGVVDEDDFAASLSRWESQGYDVGPLRKGMEKDPDRVRTAFFQFEQNVRKIQVLKDTVDALDPSGIEADISRVRALFRTPYQIWRIEAEMATLMEKADNRDRARRPRVAPPPPRPPVRARPPGVTNGGPSLGRVNGLVAAGKVNGLINGLSRARAGLTNGLTNGVGVTNGLAGRRFAAEVRSRRSRILLIPAVVFLLLSITLIVPPEGEPHRGGVRVDGEFRDWERVPGYTEPSVAGNPDVDLRGYRALWREDRLSVYANVTGTAFRNPIGLDVWYAFLDADGNRTSGYDEGRLGADVLIEVQGGNGTVSSAQAWTHAGADRADWSGWAGLGVAVSADARASEVEFQIDTADLEAQGIPFDNQSAALLLVLEDQVGGRSESSIVFGPRFGALEVRQVRASPTVPAGPADLLVLTFRAIGEAVNVTSISVLPALPGFSPITVFEGAPQTITLQLDATGLAAGTVVSAELADVRADRPATILGGPARAYVGFPPPEKRVDGLFSEWNDTATDSDPVQNPDVDILEHAAQVENGTAFLFVQVAGRALGGGHEAHLRSRPRPGPAGSPGPPGLPERRAGENLVRVFYDSNATDQGIPIGGIVADTYVEIRGRHGRVGSARSFVWAGGWTPTGSVAAIAGGDGLEGSVDIPGLQGADYVIESRDWRQTVDRTSVGGVRGLRSTPEGVTFVGNYDATIPASADGWIRFARGGTDVAWRLPRLEVVGASGARWSADPGPTPFTPAGSGGAFRGAYDSLGLDVAYEAGSMVFKETFRFDSPPAIDPEEFLLLDTPVHRHADLMLEATGETRGDELVINGSLSFVDGRGLALTFLAPWISDAAGSRLDLRFSWSSDHLRIRVPGSWLRDAAYPVVLDPTTTYTLRNQGPSADNGEQLGWSVAVGDFNGDGYADVLTGAPSNNLGGSNHGYAYIFFGPFTADDSTPDVWMNGTETSAQMGYSVAAGRFNDDAYWDALVARRSVGSITGPVSLFYGSASWSGLDNTPDVNFSAPSSPQSFGWAVAGGNLDNANSDDVLISEPGKDNDGGLPSADGIVHVYLSPFSATESSADFTLFPSSNATGQLGRSLAVGKIDSDAYADVIAGEPIFNETHDNGRVQFYRGISFASGSGNRYPNATLSAQASGEQFGSSAAVGKLNGDSYDDLAVGAPFTTTDAGAVYLYNANSDGTGLTTGASPAVTLASQSANERFGISVVIVDFDNDGTNGVMVGATHANAGGTRRGSAYWFDDPLTDQIVDETMSGTQTDERFGQSLAAGKFASNTRPIVAIGAYLWDDTANDNDGRAVVAEVPEPGTTLVAVVLLAVFGGRLFQRRRLVRKR